MYYEPIEQKYYIESLVMSRAQITQLLLGRSSSASKAPYKLKECIFIYYYYYIYY